jgi:YD repeat-containing protein
MKALGCVWEYDYTSYGDVKRVKDPEGGTVAYGYDYELGEPAYGQVRRVIDALGRATEYAYYGADDTNLARRGLVRRVVVPGGIGGRWTMAVRAGWCGARCRPPTGAR